MVMYLDQTRSIYQRKLLEVLTHETTEGYDSDKSVDSIDDENRLYPDLPERRNRSYGLPNQPLTIRNDYKATKSTRNTDDVSKGVRSRIPPTSTKVNDNPKQQIAKKSTYSISHHSFRISI